MRYVWSFALPDREVGCTIVCEDNEGAFLCFVSYVLRSAVLHTSIMGGGRWPDGPCSL